MSFLHFRFLLALLLSLLFHPTFVQASASTSTTTPEKHSDPVITVDANLRSLSLVGHLDYLEDKGGNLTLEQVQPRRAEFRPTDPVKGVNFGYTASAYWFRVVVETTADSPSDWLLEIAYPPLDRIDLYTVSGNAVRHMHSGDHEDFSVRPVAHRNFVFPLHLPSGTRSEVLFRVTSSGTITVPTTFWRPDAFARASETSYAVLAAYFGWLVALGLYNLMLYFSTRERVFATYVSFVLFFAAGSMAFTGLAAQYLWPGWPRWGDLSLPICLAAAIFFGTQFTRQFLGTRRARWIDRLLTANSLLSVSTIVLAIVMPLRLATILLAASGFIFALTGLLAGVLSARQHHPGSRYFLGAWGIFFVGVFIFSLRNTGLIPTNTFTLYAMQMGSALEMLLLSFALADRLNTLRREKDAAQQAALTAGKTLVETLKRSEAELEQRVNQRTRDLADANDRLRENEALLRNIAHHDALTGLANRLLLHAHLDQAFKRTRRSGEQFALMMIDLDGFKPINDAHGHDAGDQVLREVAARLSAGVRETDLVARLGGDEFVAVLESVNEPDAAFQVGQKLIDDIGKPLSLTSGATVHVGASIGLALSDPTTSTSDDLLRVADEAMYDAKAAGKNCCRLG
jgi:diguanylate cyclase (GGDEF)-like protein